MKLQKQRGIISLVVTGCLVFTTEFGTLAANPQSEAQAIETINYEVHISPLKTVCDQIPEMAEVAAQKAAEKAAAEAAAAEEARKAEAVKTAAALRKEEIKKIAQSASDKELLAALIYCEAGNQLYDGKVAVGAVVLNRVRSSRFPNTIREVIYQPGQFGPAITGKLDRFLATKTAPQSCWDAAEDALNGISPVGDKLFFGCGNYGQKLGDHWFH